MRTALQQGVAPRSRMCFCLLYLLPNNPPPLPPSLDKQEHQRRCRAVYYSWGACLYRSPRCHLPAAEPRSSSSDKLHPIRAAAAVSAAHPGVYATEARRGGTGGAPVSGASALIDQNAAAPRWVGSSRFLCLLIGMIELSA